MAHGRISFVSIRMSEVKVSAKLLTSVMYQEKLTSKTACKGHPSIIKENSPIKLKTTTSHKTTNRMFTTQSHGETCGHPGNLLASSPS